MKEKDIKTLCFFLPTRTPSTKEFKEAERAVQIINYIKNKKKEGK